MTDDPNHPDRDAEAPPAGEQDLPDFEHSLSEVQQIIDQMEAGEVSLERSLEHYGRGMKLIQHCDKVLQRAEVQFRKLSPPPPPPASPPSEEASDADEIF